MVNTYGQQFDATKVIAAEVQLDSVVIVASRSGFDPEDFIRLVQEDESLYEAFHNLRTASYDFRTEMSFVDKKDATKATYMSTNSQYFDGVCRTMKTHSESWTGDFYKGKRQKHRYYTYAMYDRLFLTHGRHCLNAENGAPGTKQPDAMERHVEELKNLIFRPGKKSDIPFMGKKTEIFSPDMIGLYDYTIGATLHRGAQCYTFTATVKDAYVDKENKTVFKALSTIFSKADFQVVSRSYTLSQDAAAYMFDITMDVDLVQVGDQYYPSLVKYAGTWNIPTKRKESGTFSIFLDQFK
jgi:hypothetical protein